MRARIALLALLMGLGQAMAQQMPLELRNAPAKGGSAPAKAPPASQPDGLDTTEILVQKYGTIIDRKPVGAGGLTAWTVEKNGRRVVLYTTADGQAIISGIVWESMTGRNLSDQFIPRLPSATLPPAGGSARSAEVPGQSQGAALLGKFSGELPESIKTVDSLAGIKEGKGGPADTLFIIVDPRCPYCRKAYQVTREYVKRGFTIKWIPVVALGNPAQGTPLAATVLQAKPAEQAEALRRVLGNKEEVATAPTKATEAALTRNLDFFFAAFQNNGVDQAGVPAAFFLDKRTGKARMMTGISELPVVEEVFGRLQ